MKKYILIVASVIFTITGVVFWLVVGGINIHIPKPRVQLINVFEFWKNLRYAIAVFFKTFTNLNDNWPYWLALVLSLLLAFSLKRILKRFRRGKSYRKVLAIYLIFAIVVLSIPGIFIFKYKSKTYATWWPGDGNGVWQGRKQLTVVNNSGDTLAQNTTIAVTINTKQMVSEGKLQTDCDDLRVVYDTGSSQTALDRHISYPDGATCASTDGTRVYFKIQEAGGLANAASSTYYYVYYGNPQASTLSNPDNAFDISTKNALLVCPFDGSTTCAAGETASAATGAIRYSGAKSALSFDGIDDYVSATDGTSISVSEKLTLEAWVKVSKTSSEQTIVGKWDETTANDDRSYRLYITSGNKFAFSVSANGTAAGVTTITGSTTTVSTDTWYHVAGVYNPTGTTLDLYVNGISDATQVTSGPASIDDNSSNLYIGGKENTSGVLDTFLYGVIDEVMISATTKYTSSFNPPTWPQIRDNYTKALYHFDENGDDLRQSSKIIDDSGYGNHATVTEAVYVSGLVGVNSSSYDTGKADGGNVFGGHEGVFIEEGTVNLVTNPSFEHTTFDTSWSTPSAVIKEDTVTTTTNQNSVSATSRRTWYDGTRYWTSFVNSSSLPVFYYSTDGENWTENVQAGPGPQTSEYTIVVNEQYAFLIYRNAFWDIEVRQAENYPGTSFSWGPPSVAFSGSGSSDRPYIRNASFDSNGKIWIVYDYYNGTNYTYRAIRSTNNYDATSWGSEYSFLSNTSILHDQVIVPLDNGDMYHVFYQSGSSIYGCIWDAQSSVRWEDSSGNDCTNAANYDTIGSIGGGLSAQALADTSNNDVHLLVGGQSAVTYYRWDNGSGTNGVWQSSVNITSGTNLYNDNASLTVDTDTQDIYAMWINFTDNIWRYSVCDVSAATSECSTAGDWSTVTDLYTVTSAGNANGSSNYSGSNNVFLLYRDLTASPYEINFVIIKDPRSETPIENTTSPYYKFGSKSSEITAVGDLTYVTNIDSGNDNTHILSAYVYNGTSGAVGSTIDSSVVALVADDALQTTIYTDMGGGWWRLSYSGSPGDFVEYQSGFQDGDKGLFNVANQTYISQGFRLTQAGEIDTAEIYVKKVGAGTPTTTHYQLTIETDSSNLPSGSTVTNGTSSCEAVTTSTSYGYETFTFSTPPSLSADTQYHLVLKPYTNSSCTTLQPSADSTNYISVGYDEGGTDANGKYYSGDMSLYSGASWSNQLNDDVIFNLYVASAKDVGIRVKTGKTVYLDGVQFEEKSIATTYADGSLGTGYAWSGTAHTSATTRTKADLYYPATTANISASAGSVSFWMKPDWAGNDSILHELFAVDTSAGTLRLYKDTDNSLKLYDGTNTASKSVSWTAGQWQHIVADWGSSNMHVYVNGSAGTAAGAFSAPTINTSGYINVGESTSEASQANSVISDLRIFDSVLTSTEITDTYYAGLVSHTEEINDDSFDDNKGQAPVAIWHMDEGYGTSVGDSSQYENTLTLSGASWDANPEHIGNNLGKALDFDGSDDKLSRSWDRDFDFGTGSFTIAGWFRHASSTSGTDTILSRYDNAGYKVYMDSSGYICFDIDSDGTWGSSYYDTACTTSSYADSKWHRFEAVKNGITSVTLYIDGEQKAQDSSIAANTTLNDTATLYIGTDSNGSSNYWDGILDDIVIYPYAHSSEQVKADILGVQTSVLYGAEKSDSLTDGLIGYWKMDEGQGTDVYDYSSNEKDGSWSGSGTHWGSGKFGQSGNFNGDDDYVDLGTISSGDPLMLANSEFTVSAWVKQESGGDLYQRIVDKSDGSLASNGYDVYFDLSEHFQLQVNGNRYYHVLSGSYSYDTWYFVTAVATSEAFHLYINGNEVSGSWEGGSPALPPNVQTNMKIGSWNHTTGREFKGNMDEVRIYNRALSPGEVQQLYNWAPGPVGWWKMDEGSWTNNCSTDTVFDSSGNGLNGDACPNGTGPVGDAIGKLGKGGYFDGSDDYINLGNPSALQYVDSDFSWTISLWYKSTDAVSNGRQLLYKAGGWSVACGYMYGNNACYFDQLGGSYPRAYSTNNSFSPNVWQHLAITGSGTASTIKLYINGIDQTGSRDSDFSYDGSTYDLNISVWSGNGIPWKGFIDDVRIYNYARTPAQIIEDMNAGHPVPGSPIGSAVAEWKFDEGALNTCTGGVNDFCDDSINANDLAFSTTSAGYTNSGKFGKAFNGTNAVWASRSDDADFDVSDTDDYTISLWYKGDNATNPSTTEYLFNKASGSTAGYAVYANSSDSLCFGIDDDTSWDPDVASCTATDYYDTTWHHLVAVRDHTGTDRIYLYIDGILKDSDSDTTTVTLANSLSLYLADRDGTNNGDEFTGDLDDVKVYRSALTASQVKILYNQGKSQVLGALSTDASGNPSNSAERSFCPPGDSTSTCAPVGDWKLDENTGTTSYDSSGNGSVCTLYNGPVWKPGKYGSSLFFDGASGASQDDYVICTRNSSIDNIFDGGGTVTGWMKVNSMGDSNGRLVAKGQNGATCAGGGGWYTLINQSGSNMRFNFYADFESNQDGRWYTEYGTWGALPMTDWHHFAVVYNDDSSSNDPTFYLDGQKFTVGSGILESSTPANSYCSDVSYNMAIGAVISGAYTLDGSMDNVRFYNYELTQSQVAWDFNRGAPIAHWKFDEGAWNNDCSTDTVFDSSANANHGDSCSNGNGQTTPEAGKRNGAMHFDDSDDYVSVADDSVLDLTSSMSFSAWIKTDANEADNVILSKGSSYEVGINADGDVYWTGDSTQDDGSAKAGSATWHHIAITNDDTTVTYYVDGIQTGTDSSGIAAVNDTSLYIGYDGTNYFDGLIDDVKLYNYVMTAQQIKDDYNGGAIRFAPVTGTP